MATSYTADIIKGITFEEFALRCARNFGVLIDMRDEPIDASIPEEFKVDSYHINIVKEKQKKLKEIQALNFKEIQKIIDKQYEQEINYIKKDIGNKKKLLDKYKIMLQKVKDWEPPTLDHVNLKKFMMEQIEDSIKWDCNLNNNIKRLHLLRQQHIKFTPQKWKKEQIQNIITVINYHKKQYNEESKRIKERNQWIKKLRESV